MITILLETATANEGFWQQVDPSAVATIVAAVLASLLTVWSAAWVYRRQQRETRRQARALQYAEAIQAVEDYCEAPYRILRKDGTAATRIALVQHVSDVQSRINVHSAWMDIHAKAAVASSYAIYVVAAKAEAGPHMTTAWRARPVKKDDKVPLGTRLPRPQTDAALATLKHAMRNDLKK